MVVLGEKLRRSCAWFSFLCLFLPRLQQSVGVTHNTQGGFFGVKGLSDEQEQWMSLSLGQ